MVRMRAQSFKRQTDPEDTLLQQHCQNHPQSRGYTSAFQWGKGSCKHSGQQRTFNSLQPPWTLSEPTQVTRVPMVPKDGSRSDPGWCYLLPAGCSLFTEQSTTRKLVARGHKAAPCPHTTCSLAPPWSPTRNTPPQSTQRQGLGSTRV